LLQLVATLPFQVICSLVFSFTAYGMANLKRSGVVLIEHGVLVTLLYLIAVQVRQLRPPLRMLAGVVFAMCLAAQVLCAWVMGHKTGGGDLGQHQVVAHQCRQVWFSGEGEVTNQAN
jgi:hypothetical protein